MNNGQKSSDKKSVIISSTNEIPLHQGQMDAYDVKEGPTIQSSIRPSTNVSSAPTGDIPNVAVKTPTPSAKKSVAYQMTTVITEHPVLPSLIPFRGKKDLNRGVMSQVIYTQ